MKELISVAYRALQAAENYGVYANDAEQVGDNELASIFRDLKNEEQGRADLAKKMLASRLEE